MKTALSTTAPWAQTPSSQRREPTASEIQNGFPCGAPDRALFNELFYRLGGAEAELAHLVAYAGLTPSETDLQQVRKAILLLNRTAPVQAFIAPSASNTIPSGGAATKITNFGTITNGIGDVATWNAGLSRLTITKAGWYSLGVCLDTNLPIGTTGYGVSYSLGRNGGASIVGNNVFSSSAMIFGPYGTASGLYYLAVNDYIEAFAAHNFGSSLSMPIRFTVKMEGV